MNTQTTVVKYISTVAAWPYLHPIGRAFIALTYTSSALDFFCRNLHNSRAIYWQS